MTNASNFIHKLPFELMGEIFAFVLDMNKGHRKPLAFTCRSWRLLILHNPLLWSRIHTGLYVGLSSKEEQIVCFKRRVELTGSVLVDIRMEDILTEAAEILDILSKIELQRWRTLELRGAILRLKNGSMFEGFRGRFTSLQSLHIASLQSNADCQLYTLIATTARSMKSLVIAETIESIQFLPPESIVWKNISHLDAPACFIRFAPHLRTLKITTTIPSAHLGDVGNITKGLTLLKIYRCDLISLAAMQLPNITRLDIQIISEFHALAVVKFPNLVHFHLGSPSIRIIPYLSAPKLEVLQMPMESTIREMTSDVFYVFSRMKLSPESPAPGPPVSIAPRELRLDVNLSVQALLIILGAWPQLEKVSLCLGYSFIERGAFIDAFRETVIVMVPRKNGTERRSIRLKLCPRIRELTFRWNPSRVDEYDWIEIMRYRPKLPFITFHSKNTIQIVYAR